MPASPSHVFNLNNRDHINSTLFLSGDSGGCSLQRYETQKYPQLKQLLDTQLGFFWRPQEVNLSLDATKFPSLAKAPNHILTSNISRQTMLDSVMGRAPDAVFGPSCSEPTLEAILKIWSMMETVHSLSYSHIIQTVYPDPSLVFDNILNIEEIVKCSKSISTHYDAAINMHLAYQRGEVSRYDVIKALYVALHTANSLESVRFAVSFACSFAFAQSGDTPGIGEMMKLINRDENAHCATTSTLISLLPKDDGDFLEASKDKSIIETVEGIWDQVVIEEEEWIDYLFMYGSVLGLNKEILRQYLHWQASNKKRIVGVDGRPLNPPPKNPIPWINTWLKSGSDQPAPQEVTLGTYERGTMNMNITLDSAPSIDFGF